uniref:C2 domain-containing protein n=1 Tax=Anopheles stephensi TaxID=30069 RepID=A0A182YP13_ANOST
MVINPGHSGSDGEGPSDSDSSDNQSIRTAGEPSSYYGEVAGFPPFGGYEGDADDDAAGGAIVLKRVKNISDFGETECANEHQRSEPIGDKLVRKCAEVSIEQPPPPHNESTVGGRRRLEQGEPSRATVTATVVDHQSSVKCTARKGGSRKSGEIDSSSPLPNQSGEPALVDPCYANIGESNTHHHQQQQQQQLEEKGTVSRCAPEALSYAPDADCQQQQQEPHSVQRQRYDSINVEEKPQHHHERNDGLPYTGNGISSVTGVYRVRTPSPILPPTRGTNAATCVSSAADGCVSGATTTTTLGDISSPHTPHTVVDTAAPSSSTFTGGSGNRYTSLMTLATRTAPKATAVPISESRSLAAPPNIASEGVVASVVQVNVASSSPTTTTVKTVPSSSSSSAEDIVCVQSHDHDEITAGANAVLVAKSASMSARAKSRTGSVVSGAGQEQHHHEHTSIARSTVELVSIDDDAADGCGDQKSSTEEYEKNPTLDAAGTLMDHCDSPSVQSVPAMDGEHLRSENDVQVNSADRSSDFDDFGQQIGVGENLKQQQRQQQCVRVPNAAGAEKLVQPVSSKSADESNRVYGNEMERYAEDGDDDDGGDDDDDDGCDGMPTQIGNVTANENVTVTTGSTTLSAVICLEDGLADDDSWVEEISQDEEEFATTTATDSDMDDSSEEMSFSNDREEELRGYNRTAIDFTLHTIVEESCEDSEIESRGSDVQGRRRGRRNGRGGDHGSEVGHDGDMDDGTRDPAHRLSASELEKYFFYGLGGDGGSSSKMGGSTAGGGAESYGGTGYGAGMHDDQSEMSEESSSLCSDGHDSLGSGTASGSASAARLSGASMESHDRDNEDNSTDSVTDLASSRLEKYFLTGFLGYNSTDRGSAGGGNGGGGGGGGGGNGSDGSGGSVGSDSEGHVSPEQRRKRLVRARGATRSQSSLDNLLLAGKDAEHTHESMGSNISQSAGSSYEAAGMIAGGSGTGSGVVIGGNGDMDHSSETDTCDESSAMYSHQDRSESSPYDTMGKRKKKFMTKKMDVALARAEQQQQQQHHGAIGDVGLSGICSESEDIRKTPSSQSTSLDMVTGREPPGVVPGVISSSLHPAGIENSRKQTSRDSGFIGSNDDLLKEDQTVASSSKAMPFATVEPILEENRNEHKESDAASTEANPAPSCNASRLPISPGTSSTPKGSTQGAGMVNLVRKDSFNNWSSDEETNLMMSKMRQFFKSLVAASANTRKLPNSSSSTPGVSGSNTPQQGGSTPVARPRGMRTKPPQLVYFESELTRLMKTVPGIRDEQVREIVEYLSSEDTWSDSYDSSDYTSSDLEGTAAAVAEGNPFGLQEEISASCRQIINKFDSSVRKDEEGDIGDGGLVTLAMAEKAESPLVAHHRHHHHLHQPHGQQQQQQPYHQTPLSKETAFVYQRLVASLSKVVSNEPPGAETKDPTVDVQPNAAGIAVTTPSANSTSSPPLIAKVMHHIGSRLVALMHEVSSGESHASISPKPHRIGMHRKSGQAMAGNVGGGVSIGAAGNTSAGMGALLGHHHHHHHHHLHHHHQAISATTTEDDDDSSTSESNDRQHPPHYHHHRSRIGIGAATAPETSPPAGQEEDEEIGAAIEGGASVSSSSYAMMLPRSKSHDLLLSDQRSQGHYQYHSGTGSDMVGEERGEASDYERFSWRGSFESALLANGDSRTKLSMLDNSSSSKSILVAKRRSAGDLLFNNQNLSQEQLDRVRSCGSIGGDREELWEEKGQQPHPYHQNQPYHSSQQPHQQQLLHQQQHHQQYAHSSAAGSRRRLSSVAADEEDTDSDDGVMKGAGSNRLVLASRSTLPRSLQNTMTSGTTNSLPRLPTSHLQTIMQSVASSPASSSSGTGGSLAISPSAKPAAAVGTMGQKSQSVYHFLQNNVKSARYRAPGFNRPPSAPKRAMSAPGLQPPYPRRERRNRLQHLSNEKDAVSVSTICNVKVSKSDFVQQERSGNQSHLVRHTGGRSRVQPNNQKRWKFSFGCCCQRKRGLTSASTTPDRSCSCSVLLSRWSGLACCCSWWRCCRCCNRQGNDEEDVDAAFAAYKLQLGTVLDGSSEADGAGTGSDYDTLSPSQKSTIRKLNKNASWGWNDSFRSVSDRFLESLELDDVSTGDSSLRKKFSACCRKRLSSPFRDNRAILGEIELEECNSPDLTGSTGALGGEDEPQGNGSRAAPRDTYDRQGDGTPSNGMQHKGGSSIVSSPVGSAGGGSDNWPSQSDEDIDRLVALHQNRASLSSLGVRSDSMASVYSGAGEGRYGTVTVRGQIEFGMQYNYKQGALEIHVKQCKDLAAVDTKRNRSDPYVKVYLLPDKSKSGKRKTKVKKHTLNPVFDEVLRFHMSLNSLQTRTIWITVWHSDMFGRNDFLGEVMMGLQDKVFDNPQAQWYQLQERSEPFEDLSAYKGDIIVGLKYVSADADSGGMIGAGSGGGGGGATGGSGGSTGSGFGTLNLRKFSTRSLTSNSSSTLSGHSKGALHVLVKEAKHLQPIKSNGTCDAFCKSYLLPDKNRSSKQKTPVIKRTNSPVWNYTFVYEDVSLAELSERALELTIWDHDRLASNEFLGGVRFSLGNGKHNGRAVEWMDSTGKELSLWQNMINRPNFWVEGALVLRPSLENAKFST